MNKREIIRRIEESEEPIRELKEERLEIIAEEAKVLMGILIDLDKVVPKKMINGHKCILMYVFKNSSNDAMADEVYLSSGGYVTYQIYDEVIYKGFVPDANIVNGFVRIELVKFLENVMLENIVEFLEERPDILKQKEFDISEKNDERRNYLNNFIKNNA